MTIDNNSATPVPTAAVSTAKPVAAKPASVVKAPTPKAKPKAKPAPEGKYKVLTGIDDAAFCDRVSDHLEHGWELYGNVAATYNGKNVILAQPLLKSKKSKRKKK